MSRPSILVLDTLDDRRELWCLLHRLSPRRRVSFLADCCDRVRRPDGAGPVASRRMAPAVALAYRCGRADDRLTTEVYGDLLVLACQWGLDLAAAAAALEGRVRRRGDRRDGPPAASASTPSAAPARTPCSTG